MPDASPTKWHLAHTSWFFETFLLARAPGYRPFNASYGYLFNSYYDALGERQPRHARGLLSRPTLAEVMDYRWYTTQRVLELVETGGCASEPNAFALELGIQHEQQHQELLVTDIKNVLGLHPYRPPYHEGAQTRVDSVPALGWHAVDAGVFEVGHSGSGFAYDNELPQHRVFLERYEIATRLVTNGEFLDFVRDGGYQRPELWLSEGFRTAAAFGWNAPLYWNLEESGVTVYTMSGAHPLMPYEPVCHVSYYEADAYARWVAARLPSEFEWERAAAGTAVHGNFLNLLQLHPIVAISSTLPVLQMFGDVWEWTQSAYGAYPGFVPAAGVFREYNAKFMCNQMVLRGGSCATPRDHVRATYRNFFPPDARWQFTGIRLARST